MTDEEAERKSKRYRPREKALKTIQIRLTEAEKETIEYGAQLDRRSMSSFLVYAGINYAQQLMEIEREEEEEQARIDRGDSAANDRD